MSDHHHNPSAAALALDANGFPVMLAPAGATRPPKSVVAEDPDDAVIVRERVASPGKRLRRLLAARRRGLLHEAERQAEAETTLASVAGRLGLREDQVEGYAHFGLAVLTARRALKAVMAEAAEEVPGRAREDAE